MNSRPRSRLYQLSTLAFLLLQFIPNVSTAEVILINQPATVTNNRYNYPKKLLTAIFNVTETEYGQAIIKATPLKMSRDRTLQELEKGLNIHVMAEASKQSWEQRLIPVRIPIRKGIQGYRTFLILKKNSQLYQK